MRNFEFLEKAMDEDFIVLDKRTIEDGRGGIKTTWVEGATIKAAVEYSSSSQIEIAKALGSVSTHKITVNKSVKLDFHDVLRRNKNGEIYRITSQTSDFETPDFADFQIRKYTAEIFIIPDD